MNSEPVNDEIEVKLNEIIVDYEIEVFCNSGDEMGIDETKMLPDRTNFKQQLLNLITSQTKKAEVEAYKKGYIDGGIETILTEGLTGNAKEEFIYSRISDHLNQRNKLEGK